jgi:hypothetical protein
MRSPSPWLLKVGLVVSGALAVLSLACGSDDEDRAHHVTVPTPDISKLSRTARRTPSAILRPAMPWQDEQKMLRPRLTEEEEEELKYAVEANEYVLCREYCTDPAACRPTEIMTVAKTADALRVTIVLECGEAGAESKTVFATETVATGGDVWILNVRGP